MAQLQMTKRDEFGTRPSRRLREQGLVPGIVYGHGGANTPVTVTSHDIELAISHGERLVETSLGGENANLLIKEVQYDHFGHYVIHVDFTRVSLDERVEVVVPILLRGLAVGVETEDGVLAQHLNELPIECLVTAIPEDIRVRVNDLHVDDSLRVADLELPEGVTAQLDDDILVASVAIMAEEEEVPAEEGEVEAVPEVIGEKPAEGEEAGEAEAEGEGA